MARIRENSNFFRSELQKMGFDVLGDNDSPVMPIMLYNPAKMPAFSRQCLQHNVRFLHPFFEVLGKTIKSEASTNWFIRVGISSIDHILPF